MSDPMAPFRARFVARARDEVAILRQARLAAAPPAAFATVVHQMAGLAGSVGYAEISRLAALIDEALYLRRPPPDDALDALIAAIDALPPSG